MVHRLFLGMPLPDEAADLLHDWASSNLPEGVQRVPRANLHVTLVFIGDRSETELHELERVVSGIAWPGIQVSTGRLRLMGRGAVVVDLMVGTTDAHALSQVDVAIGKFSADSGRSSRPSQLHVTLGRSRGRPNLDGAPRPPAISMSLDRLHLYESTQMPRGAQYSIVASSR